MGPAAGAAAGLHGRTAGDRAGQRRRLLPRARFLLPAFPLLLPLALHLSRASRRHRMLVLAAAVVGSAYCGAYMALVYPGAP
ncbi:hypothetical protein ACQF36_08775 [Streptomyces sp. Marseille-Q5077]|uniref:hypothetical protein n=1 Tax=Streptomyces sp. Marseille-Q5077 TaxID=3418995 RepID=UPI003D08675B